MFRAILLLTLFSTCALLVSAQESARCSLKYAQTQEAQELQGLRLGMTIAQVKTRVPTLELGPADAFGLVKTSFTPALVKGLDRTGFENVRTISLEFLDGRVSSVWIGYSDTFKWKSLDEFVDGMSRSMGLRGNWTARSRGGGQQLECEDFRLEARMIGGGPSLYVSDKQAHQTWEKRRAESETKESTEP